MKRQSSSLTDKPWRFSPDPYGDGEQLGFWRDDTSTQMWPEVTLPCCFQAGRPGLDFYEGVCWYRRAFALPAEWRDRRIILRFEAVNYRAKVWINNELIGENRDGFLPFEFEIGNRILWDAENTLAVSVDNSHHEGDVPGMHVGWRGVGGIIRDVSLYATDQLHIQNVHVNASASGDMEFRVRVQDAGQAGADAVVDVTVEDKDGAAAAHLEGTTVTLAGDGGAEVILRDALSDALTWSPTTPALYHARVRLIVGGQAVDETNVTFGFRSIEATPEGLLLNGEKIYLTGFNRHEDSPRTDMAVDHETTRADLEAMKEAGSNFVRLCHYPHDSAELDMCDKLGLLVFAEIPLYFWNDEDEGRKTQAARAETATRQLERMIARDFNHPSIIFWSVSNETQEKEPEIVESNDKLLRLARKLDPTRLCVHASNKWGLAPHFKEDDVICVNYYPNVGFQRRGHDPSEFDPERLADGWRISLAEIHRLYPDKPVLVTEFGYCSFAGTNGHAFGEDIHARVLEAEFAALDQPFVCGATIWCWADHAWPVGRFIGALSISPYGVLTRDRHKLKPFWKARELFRAKQKIESAPRRSNRTSVTMIRPHMNDIPDAPFPSEYGIRPMTLDDIGLWTDIQYDAEQYIEITDRLFYSQFDSDLHAVSRRCFIVTDLRGVGVGTISAWYNRDFKGEDYGQIHWVAIRPSHQGKGLGKAAVSYAMKKLAQWHDRCYLSTATERVAAISLYLSFGFLPDVGEVSAREAWTTFNSRAEHPCVTQALANGTKENE